jgi:hypothetical protein
MLMKYDKPGIIDLSQAVTAIHGGQYKVPCNCAESKDILYLMTPPAYEADE